jgi:hypothetical protein
MKGEALADKKTSDMTGVYCLWIYGATKNINLIRIIRHVHTLAKYFISTPI